MKEKSKSTHNQQTSSQKKLLSAMSIALFTITPTISSAHEAPFGDFYNKKESKYGSTDENNSGCRLIMCMVAGTFTGFGCGKVIKSYAKELASIVKPHHRLTIPMCKMSNGQSSAKQVEPVMQGGILSTSNVNGKSQTIQTKPSTISFVNQGSDFKLQKVSVSRCVPDISDVTRSCRWTVIYDGTRSIMWSPIETTVNGQVVHKTLSAPTRISFVGKDPAKFNATVGSMQLNPDMTDQEYENESPMIPDLSTWVLDLQRQGWRKPSDPTNQYRAYRTLSPIAFDRAVLAKSNSGYLQGSVPGSYFHFMDRVSISPLEFSGGDDSRYSKPEQVFSTQNLLARSNLPVLISDMRAKGFSNEALRQMEGLMTPNAETRATLQKMNSAVRMIYPQYLDDNGQWITSATPSHVLVQQEASGASNATALYEYKNGTVGSPDKPVVITTYEGQKLTAATYQNYGAGDVATYHSEISRYGRVSQSIINALESAKANYDRATVNLSADGGIQNLSKKDQADLAATIGQDLESFANAKSTAEKEASQAILTQRCAALQSLMTSVSGMPDPAPGLKSVNESCGRTVLGSATSAATAALSLPKDISTIVVAEPTGFKGVDTLTPGGSDKILDLGQTKEAVSGGRGIADVLK